jgi:DNA polymerase
MCRKCKLRHDKEPVFGRGNMENPLIMFVGEAPGRNEEKQGKPFVGVAGRIFGDWVKKLNLSEEDYYVTNIVKCRPPSNRAPKTDETNACKTWLYDEINIVNPKIIVLLGRIAMFGIGGKRGRFVIIHGKPVFTMYHPMASLYSPDKEPEVEEHLNKLKAFISSYKEEDFDLEEFLTQEEENERKGNSKSRYKNKSR